MDSDHLQDLIAFIHVQCTLCTFRDDYEHSSDEFSKSLQIGLQNVFIADFFGVLNGLLHHN